MGRVNVKLKKTGAPPGASIHVGDVHLDSVIIKEILFDHQKVDQRDEIAVSDIQKATDGSIQWVQVTGLHETKKLEALSDLIGLHDLELEDILNTDHRPKVQIYEDHILVIMKNVEFNMETQTAVPYQVSLYLAKGRVVSFQERDNGLFDKITERLTDPNSNLRKGSADYLFYRLMDIVVDNYFLVSEEVVVTNELLEEKIFQTTDSSILQEIQALKRDIIKMRRSTFAFREGLAHLIKDGSNLIKESTAPYLRDVYDHVLQVSESLDAQRDVLTNIMNLYNTEVSNKMNQVMQVLTIMSALFIPLTFIAGIYGMNFELMPELGWRYGYFAALGLMIIIAVFMLLYFKRKKWL